MALFREVSDDVMLVRSLADLALFLTIEDDRAGGRAAADEALAIARPTGDDALIGAALAELAQATADPDEALALAHEAAGHLRAAGALVRVAQLYSYLGFAALAVDAYERSEELAREALGVAARSTIPTRRRSCRGTGPWRHCSAAGTTTRAPASGKSWRPGTGTACRCST